MGAYTANTDVDKERFTRAMSGDESAQRGVIENLLKPLFEFILSYSSYSREQAFQVTLRAFAAAPRRFASENDWQDALFRQAILECAQTEALGARVDDEPKLKLVRGALIRLSPGDKAVILLRDQCHLPFERIAAILGSGVRETRSLCLSARENLRARVKESLEGPGETEHAV